MKNPILGVTMGDPAGVGPEIIARACAEPGVRQTCRPLVIGAGDFCYPPFGRDIPP